MELYFDLRGRTLWNMALTMTVLSPPPLKMARTASYPTMESFTCPDNFAVVTSSVYRSSFPKPENFSYIKKLGLKTILWVSS